MTVKTMIVRLHFVVFSDGPLSRDNKCHKLHKTTFLFSKSFYLFLSWDYPIHELKFTPDNNGIYLEETLNY